MRMAQGWYQFNPKLAVRRRLGGEERWVAIYAALNLPLISEFSYVDGYDIVRGEIDNYLALAGLPKCTTPIAAERWVEREGQLRRSMKTLG